MACICILPPPFPLASTAAAPDNWISPKAEMPEYPNVQPLSVGIRLTKPAPATLPNALLLLSLNKNSEPLIFKALINLRVGWVEGRNPTRKILGFVGFH